MTLTSNEAHIWSGSLAISEAQETTYQYLLSPDETERANRFKFPRDKRRFIAARAILRKILSLYTNTLPNDFKFETQEHGKPFLAFPTNTTIQFNVSHSDEIAVYAFDLIHTVGIDIEKMQLNFPTGVSEKYFNASENKALNALALSEQPKAFYRLWASKEALIKATGKGLFTSLSDISISLKNETDTLVFEQETWVLRQLSIHPDYQAAIACHPSIKALSLFTFQHV